MIASYNISTKLAGICKIKLTYLDFENNVGRQIQIIK